MENPTYKFCEGGSSQFQLLECGTDEGGWEYWAAQAGLKAESNGVFQETGRAEGEDRRGGAGALNSWTNDKRPSCELDCFVPGHDGAKEPQEKPDDQEGIPLGNQLRMHYGNFPSPNPLDFLVLFSNPDPSIPLSQVQSGPLQRNGPCSNKLPGVFS